MLPPIQPKALNRCRLSKKHGSYRATAGGGPSIEHADKSSKKNRPERSELGPALGCCSCTASGSMTPIVELSAGNGKSDRCDADRVGERRDGTGIAAGRNELLSQ